MLWLLLFTHVIEEGVVALPPPPPTLVLPKEVTVNVVTRKWTHLLNERFLSFTLQPHIALEFQEYRPSTMSMFKGLSPAMVRLGGPEIDHVSYLTSGINTSYTISEEQWEKLNKLAQWAKLNLVVCLNPMERLHGVWQSKGALEFIDASNKSGYDLQWEMGYELQRMRNMSQPLRGSELGRDVVRLRKILDSFPRYSKSVIIGPDVMELTSLDEMKFVKEFLDESGDALAVMTWHPQFAKVDKEKEDVLYTLTQVRRQAESLIPPKDPTRSPAGKLRKDLWISESDAEDSTGEFSDALAWTKRLGTAAMLGFPVYMKQITRNSIVQPNHDYWVSVLYKSLVGRAVLEAKLVAGDRNMSHVFAHCTEMSENNIVETDFEYERGAVTLFGLNLAAEEIKLNVKASFKDEPVHIYILTAENKNNAQETYLNGQHLRLSPMGQLPVISPKVKNATRNMQVDIPPRSVYFLVLPDIKAKQCMTYPVIQMTKDSSDILEHHPNSVLHFDEEAMHAGEDDQHVYVRFGPKKKKKSKEESEVKEGSNENNVPDKLLKFKFPIPETESAESKELERSAKSIRDQDTEGKNKISKMSSKDSKLGNKIKSDRNIKYSDTVEDGEPVKWNSSDKELTEAMTNTKFVMFSDDDWLSNFSHAKKAVEAAKKIIEAFDEAELMKKKECEKQSSQSSILKVENDKYHIQYGKDGSRKKKFAILSTSGSDSESTTKSDDSDTMPNVQKTSTDEPHTTTIMASEPTITDTSTAEPLKTTTQTNEDLHSLHEGQQTIDTNNEFSIHNDFIEPTNTIHRVEKRSLKPYYFGNIDSSNVNTHSHITKIKKQVDKKKVRRSVANDKMSENLEVNVRSVTGYSGKEPSLDNGQLTDCSDTDIQSDRGGRLMNGKETDLHDFEEDRGDSDAYHPGEFYEHRNLQKFETNKRGHFEDMFEAESRDRSESDRAHDDGPSGMTIVKEMCKDSDEDKRMKDKVEADLKQYYKNAEKLVKATEHPEDHDESKLHGLVNDQMTSTKIEEQRVKRKSEDQLKNESKLAGSTNEKSGEMATDSKSKMPVSAKEMQNTENSLKDKSQPGEVNKGDTPKNKNDHVSPTLTLPKQTVHVENINDLKENVPQPKEEKQIPTIKTNPSNGVVVNIADKVSVTKVEPKTTDSVKSEKYIVSETTQTSMNNLAAKERQSTELKLENEGINIDKNRAARDSHDSKRTEPVYRSEGINVLDASKKTFGANTLNDNRPVMQKVALDKKTPDIQSEKNNTLNSMPMNNQQKHENPSNLPDKKSLDISFPSSNTNVVYSKENIVKDEKQNFDIVCGRTKNFGTFCVGSENKISDDHDEYEPRETDKNDDNDWETQNGNTDSTWQENGKLNRKGTSDAENLQKVKIANEKDDYVHEGSPTCKASRSAPYIEDFEELLTQIDDFRKHPGNERHRRLVHFTVPAVNMKEVDDKKELPSYFLPIDHDSFDKSEDEMIETDKTFHGRHSDQRNRQMNMEMKEKDMHMSHKSSSSNSAFSGASDKLFHELHNGFEDEMQKEQTKRTISSVPRIKPKRRPYRKDELFGQEGSYQTVGSDSETGFESARKSNHRNVNNEEQYPQNNYKDTYPHHRKPMPRDEFSDYGNDEASDYYYRRPVQSTRGVSGHHGNSDYDDRYYNNDRGSNVWEDKQEKGYVRLPGDVYSEMEGTRGPLRSKEPHFTKSEPVQMMPVAQISPDMYKPKPTRQGQRTKRSVGPYFRDVRNDVAVMKKEVMESSQFAHQKDVHPTPSKTKLRHDFQSNQYSGIRTDDRIIRELHRLKRSDTDIRKTDMDNLIHDRHDDMLRSNNIRKRTELQNDSEAFDEELINEKNRQLQLLQKKLSDLAKLYAREKDLINDGLTVIVDDKNDAIEISKNGSKLLISNTLKDISSVASEEENHASEILEKDENKSGTEMVPTEKSNTSLEAMKRNKTSYVSVRPAPNRSTNGFAYVVNQMRNLVHFIMTSLVQI